VTAGALMTAEIAEQPEVLARLLATAGPSVLAVAEAIRAAAPRFVLFAARGTSDHAALYGKYLAEVRLGWAAGLASPSSMTAYGARPDLRDVLFIAVSQSGASPDLVESTTTARECGALTLAVTNNASSALASAAQLHLDVLAGPERAVAATKTYSAELLTLWMLVDALCDGDFSSAAALPDAVAACVREPSVDVVAAAARRYVDADRIVLTARGYSYATVAEAALKLMETSYLAAQSFSGADLLHGPMAMVSAGTPVIAVVSCGHGGRAMEPVIARLEELGADLFVVGEPAAVARTGKGFVLPAGVSEELSPLMEIVPLQRLACSLALARGLDPDAPRGLTKVTHTL
jgi:glucosamine--fructose-6-phosphate aminotransferase (isomerizing)